jgi:ABC-type antimicrobial peptide transport system permease subunit
MNLSTARSEKRAKEVGIRKTLGSIKTQLVGQFLSESFLVVLLAFVFSILFVLLSLSWFSQLADKDISLPFLNPAFWAIIIVFVLFTGIIAGLYPALYLSSFKPAKVLKGILKSGRFGSIPRKVLVVVQFTVSVVLIVGTIIVYQQIQYARNRPVGYNRQGLVSVPMNDPNYQGKYDVIKAELLNTGMVTHVALSSNPVTQVYNNSGGFSWRGRDPQKDNDFSIFNVTHDFGSTVGWQFLTGRDFSKDFGTDSAGVIINETAAKYMGLKNPVGEQLVHNGGLWSPGGSSQSWKIIGVIKDMVVNSPYEPVKQTLFFLDYNYLSSGQMTFKLKATVSAGEALPKVAAVFKKIVPTASFDYKFVDEEFALKFSQEERIGKLSGTFAILAIFISCLGLFGLASFVAEQRTKEIGIRKVVGASVFSLWKLLSKDFIVLVFISCLIAIPVAYYYMHDWLLKYQYRTKVTWDVFVVAIGLALMITLLTVSFQAIKAASANPVKSLRSE